MVQGAPAAGFSYDTWVVDYDEFGYFDENLAEWGLVRDAPHVRRAFVAVEGLRQVSALVWGATPPELVLVHGSGQNAHTFDTVALALARPLVAIDLPHHGHSDASFYGARAPTEHAQDVARVLAALTTPPVPLAAMSYGGLVSIALTHAHPELVRHLVLIDITPGVDATTARHILDFIDGPESFADFDEILARTIAFNPGRSESSLRRGVLHNAVARPDGTWVWRHQRHGVAPRQPDRDVDLWRWLEEVSVPVTLVRAMGPSSVVSDEDVAEFVRRRPHDEVIEVPEASHSIQGSHPVELAELLRRCVHLGEATVAEDTSQRERPAP
ncbi:MAG: alpha/beta fold hydrolase [Gallionella sp.]|jgi:pimeloyl-ACP methyl ester carboxylesterase|nr:alpha/beta fold hydrolase [Gallionella sp.]